ncbi:MAG: flavin reductase family protein [Intrasporangium sp.]|uniref:flavin reductase family protein n=1 Tax=Intrasporangium sp. TaxID=1925024 RepID=UPI0026472532|nr:flavin reductase [Intrasporangium sp.]MDN5794953.1 flavin reductase family protein [Intrasporangium sp.]
MTIHSEHPFLAAEADRDPVRRLRGRLGATVSLWTAGAGAERAGLTVSSYLIAPGEPAHILGLLQPESTLLERLLDTGTAVVQLLEWRDRELADVFAGLFPAPGGAFRRGTWEQSEWGPVLATASAWAGVRLADPADSAGHRAVGWSDLVDTVIESVVIGEQDQPLVHRRGRYVRPAT